jgi:lactoylglutathione lyase
MKLGYTIIYVADVRAAIKFYESAFGFNAKFVHESGDYAELETGETTLAFGAFSLADAHFPNGYTRLSDLEKPAGIEIAIVTDDVPAAIQSSVAAGANVICKPESKPWGQVVAYVRAPDGTLVEICTPIGA